MKRKIIISIIIGVFLFSSLISSIAVTGEEGRNELVMNYRFDFKEPEINDINIEGKLFSELELDGCTSINNQPGSPALPVKSLKILLPFGYEFKDANIKAELVEIRESQEILERKPVFPQQRFYKIGDEPSRFELDERVYATSQILPYTQIDNVGVDFCKGYQILTMNLYPVKYNPRESRLFYSPQISVSVTLKENSGVNKYFRNNPSDEEWVKNLVTNPQETKSYSQTPKFSPALYTGGICDPSDNGGLGYDYVIITREINADFQAAYNWSDFISRKESDGLDTILVTVEDIITTPDYYNSSYLFNDTPAKIREFLKDAYQDWGIQYVLIAGDQDGSAAVTRREMDSGGEYNVESDLYWSNLDKTFNADNDNYWGEEGDQGFDLYSELWIGTIPCDEGLDISNWMTKSFYYADSWEKDYLDNAAFYGGNTGWSCQGDDFMDFTYYGSDYYFGPDPNHDGPYPGFMGFLFGWDTWNALYPDMAFNTSVKWTAEPPNPGWQGGTETAAINGLKNAINNDQCTLISGIAHASSGMSLDVYSSSWESEYFNTKPFFLHDYGCHCGDMDASDDGVLHSMLFHSDTELAFATVYNTGYGWGNLYCTNSSSAWQQKLFWEYMFNLSKCGGIENWQLGKAQAFSKDEMAPMINWDGGTFREIIQCCLLFGDPAQLIKSPIIPDKQITTIQPKWNFVSIPFNQDLPIDEVSVIYDSVEYTWTQATTNANPTGSPLIDPNIFSWDIIGQRYQFSDTFETGEGYWVFSYKTCELWAHNITSPSSNHITDLEQNWNLIGVPSDESIEKDDIIITYAGNDYTWTEATTTANPTSSPLLDANIFGWDKVAQSYSFTDIFLPGEGYWMFSYQQCSLKS